MSARSLSWVFVLAALSVSGCVTTAELARLDRSGPPEKSRANAPSTVGPIVSRSQPGPITRLQSPATEVEQQVGTPEPLPQPPLPDPSLPSAGSVADSTSDASTDPDPAPDTETVLAPSSGVAIDRDSPALRGLSSIARNRLANRMAAAAAPNPGGMLANAAAGRLTSGSANTPSGGLSSILRNRIAETAGAGEEPEFNYPDIHSDPAKTYHDRFGLEEEHDRFLFPWLMNLIFEDRWLLAEKDPKVALQNQLRGRMKIDIRDPDPDTANFPNGAYTLPKGRLYIETSPVGFYGGSKSSPRVYQWEYLLRYGLTDNLEFRIFSNGFTSQARQGKQPATTGYSPLAFDFKSNFWEENTRYHIPAMGIEVYLQTAFGSPAFDRGTQPSMNLLFDQSLPLGIGFEYNVGIAGVQNGVGQTVYEFSFQWSFQREVVKDFDVFVHGFYNAASLPRVIGFSGSLPSSSIPSINVAGVGAIWTVNDRFAIFGSYNFGTTTGSPRTIALTGFAVAF